MPADEEVATNKGGKAASAEVVQRLLALLCRHGIRSGGLRYDAFTQPCL